MSIWFNDIEVTGGGKSAYDIAVENGYKGTVTQWLESLKGKDGVSPALTVTDITGGHRVTITDVTGTKSFDVMDGTSAPGGLTEIPTASATTLGGIKVGEGLKISSSGVLSLDFNHNDIVTMSDGGRIVLVGDGWGNAPYEIEMSKSDSGSGSGSGETTPETPPSTDLVLVMISASPSNGGTVYYTGEGEYYPITDYYTYINSTVSVEAVPEVGYTFSGWKRNGTIVSTNANYTFTVTGEMEVVAVFTP